MGREQITQHMATADHDDIEIEDVFPKQEGVVRKGRWFSEAGLRARDERIIEATMAHYLWVHGRIPDGFVLPPEVADRIIAAADQKDTDE